MRLSRFIAALLACHRAGRTGPGAAKSDPVRIGAIVDMSQAFIPVTVARAWSKR